MKRLLVFLLLMVSVSSVYADAQANLYLKAYKFRITGSGTKLFVTDSVTVDESEYENNLGYLGSGRNLDITAMMEEIIGDVSNSAAIPIFAYRVESNEEGPFTLTISFGGPFRNSIEGSVQTVGFKATMYNTAAEYGDGVDISRPGTGLCFTTYSNTPDIPLKNIWTVNNNGGKPWIARGSVGMVIDAAGFNALTELDRYFVNVTVRLEYGG